MRLRMGTTNGSVTIHKGENAYAGGINPMNKNSVVDAWFATYDNPMKELVQSG